MRRCLRICPECGWFAPFNSYFGLYECARCEWRGADDTPERKEEASKGGRRHTDQVCDADGQLGFLNI